ncbi:MAG: hypothetical protein J0651_04285, partial [Actinobacteria bacterium]|nr:hypothetical protein [Actinomycetota bacterium]
MSVEPEPLLEEAKKYVKDFSESAKLSEFLRSKLLATALSSPIKVSCLLDCGLACGLQNGTIAVLCPPCCKEFPTAATEVPVSLVWVESHLLQFTNSAYVALSQEDWVMGKWVALEETITVAVRANAGEVLVGFQSGCIKTYKWEDSLISTEETYPGTEGVGNISVVRGENWFLATYSGTVHFKIWQYGAKEALYCLSPQDKASIPSSIAPCTNTPIPPWSYYLFPSATVIPFLKTESKDNFALEMRKGLCTGVRLLSDLDSTRYRAKAEGRVVFNWPDFTLFFSPNGADIWLENKCEGAKDLLNLKIGEFGSAEISENGAYLYLVGEQTVHTLPLAAVETQFTHAFSSRDSYLSDTSVVLERFSSFYDSKGAEIVQRSREINVGFTPDLSFYYTYSENRTNWQLFSVKNRSLQPIIQQSEVPKVVVSEDGSMIVLVLRGKFVQIDV